MKKALRRRGLEDCCDLVTYPGTPSCARIGMRRQEPTGGVVGGGDSDLPFPVLRRPIVTWVEEILAPGAYSQEEAHETLSPVAVVVLPEVFALLAGKAVVRRWRSGLALDRATVDRAVATQMTPCFGQEA